MFQRLRKIRSRLGVSLVLPAALVFCLVSGAANASGTGEFIKGPYLIYPGTNSQMTVLWQLDDTNICTLEWNLSSNFTGEGGSVVVDANNYYKNDENDPKPYQYSYTIAELTPDTRYYYRIELGESTGDYYPDPGPGSFRTAPPDDAANVKLLVYGDTRGDSAGNPSDFHDDVCAEIINTYETDQEYQTILLHAGDWVYAGDNEDHWTNQYFTSQAPVQQMLSELPVQGCMGNHDKSGDIYEKYWSYPYNHRLNQNTIGDGLYWSFDYGPVHVVVVDQYNDVHEGEIDSHQMEWVKADLKASIKAWKFILFHEPAYTAYESEGHPNNTYAQGFIQEVDEYLRANHVDTVDIVLCGHNHFYSQCEVDGIQHITTGGGGASPHTPKDVDWPTGYIKQSAEKYHFCEIDIQGDVLTFTARDKDGNDFDSTFTLKKAVTLASPAAGSLERNPHVTFECDFLATDDELCEATLYVGSATEEVEFRGEADTDDTQIKENSSTNYSSNHSMNVDRYDNGNEVRSLIKFNNVFGTSDGQVPPDSNIISATLKLYCHNAGDPEGPVRLYRITENWVDSQVTWVTQPEYDDSYYVEVDCSVIGLWMTIDVTQFVQQWSDGANNYGLILMILGHNDGVDFNTSESNRKPVLTINYYDSNSMDWQSIKTWSLSGTSATKSFTYTMPYDNEDYIWNCMLEKASGVERWASVNSRFRVSSICPDSPMLISPADDQKWSTCSPKLRVRVSDPDADALDVAFYGRKVPSGRGDESTVIALPDTQYYSEYYPIVFDRQTQWIVDNAIGQNIVFVTHEGDIVDDNDVVSQWNNARDSMALIDPALLDLPNADDYTPAVRYGVLPGNHDMPTTYYNQYFPYTRYENILLWYGGHYPSTGNDNSYQVFSVGEDDYIIIHLENNPNSSVINWADGILDDPNYADYKAIITTHQYMSTNGSFIGNGQDIWEDLVYNHGNVYFVLCGHATGEYNRARSDTADGHTVHELLADYQDAPPGGEGGGGYLRIMRFRPAEDKVYVYTYSPWYSDYEEDDDSQLILDLQMNEFKEIGSDTNVSSGSTASVEWADLAEETEYEWYVTVTDATGNTITGPLWRFTTSFCWYVDGVNGNDANDGRSWDEAFKTISHAITQALDGDLIEVAEANYLETVDFNGTSVIVTSTDPEDSSVVANTIIDANGADFGAYFHNSEDANSILTGFTVRNASVGVSCDPASPTISNCIIEDNTNYGVFCDSSSMTIKNCVVKNNVFFGIYAETPSSPTIRYNKISDNGYYGIVLVESSATVKGNWIYDNGEYGVVYLSCGSAELINNTIVGNAEAGVYRYYGTQPKISNCILWDNNDDLYGCTATYSCIQNGDSGTGNISSNPYFVNPDAKDFHLQMFSPCAGEGNNNDVDPDDKDIDGEARKQGTVVDMGADETAYGERIYVSPGGTGDGRSWATAFGNIQDAFDVANEGDEIWVAEGTYYPDEDDPDNRFESFVLVENVAFYGGFDGTETARSQRDWVNNVTTLSGDIGTVDVNTDNSYHVVTGAGDANTIIDGFTITRGYADGPYYYHYGAGMFNFDVSPTVKNCSFISNASVDDDYPYLPCGGGGMFNYACNSIITGCTFYNNTVTYPYVGGDGGAMHNFGDPAPTITKCVFSTNHADGEGGAIYNTNCDPIIENCVFFLNDAMVNGGGIINRSGSDPIITNSTFTGNSADTGGGMVNLNNSDPIVTNCIFWENTADNNSGEIYNWDDASDPNFSYCDIEGSINGTKCAGYNSIDGGGNIDADPNFVNSNDPDGSDNVWMTGDDGLVLTTTRAIDAANGNVDPDEDILGQSRMDDPYWSNIGIGDPNYVDMGAYEGKAPPVSHWKFDEGSGSIAYDSRGDNDGSIYGATWTTGILDDALSFDGQNDYVSVPHDASLNITGDITISAWVYITQGGLYQGIVTKCVGNGTQNNPYDFRTETSAQPHLTLVRADASGHERVYSSVGLSLEDWHHALIRVENKVPDFYVDGDITGKYGDTTFTKTPTGNTNPTLIGRRADALYFNGKIDDVRIYDWALSAEEVEELYLSAQ